jgi:hypothetical protein
MSLSSVRHFDTLEAFIGGKRTTKGNAQKRRNTTFGENAMFFAIRLARATKSVIDKIADEKAVADELCEDILPMRKQSPGLMIIPRKHSA